MEGLRTILWVLTMLGSVLGGIILFLALVSSTGAPQQAASAAIAVAFVVLPYCCARALAELTRGNQDPVVSAAAPMASHDENKEPLWKRVLP